MTLRWLSGLYRWLFNFELFGKTESHIIIAFSPPTFSPLEDAIADMARSDSECSSGEREDSDLSDDDSSLLYRNGINTRLRPRWVPSLWQLFFWRIFMMIWDWIDDIFICSLWSGVWIGIVVVERRCHLRNGMLQEEQQRWWWGKGRLGQRQDLREAACTWPSSRRPCE